MVYNSSGLISVQYCLIRWPFSIITEGTTTRALNKCHNFLNISNNLNELFFLHVYSAYEMLTTIPAN